MPNLFTGPLNRLFAIDIGIVNLLDRAVIWIAKNVAPQDVFTPEQLSEWAEANGYVKPTDSKPDPINVNEKLPF